MINNVVFVVGHFAESCTLSVFGSMSVSKLPLDILSSIKVNSAINYYQHVATKNYKKVLYDP